MLPTVLLGAGREIRTHLPCAYETPAHPHELYRQIWQGRQDLNPHSTVLETERLPLSYAPSVVKDRLEDQQKPRH